MIEGYSVYIAKNRYLDTKMLRNPALRYPLEKKIADVLTNMTAHTYTQRGELNLFRRARIRDNWRVYLRVHEKFSTAVIVAFDNASDTKRNESAGSLHPHFVETVLQYQNLDISSIDPLDNYKIEERKVFRPEDRVLRNVATWRVADKPTTELDAIRMLSGTHGAIGVGFEEMFRPILNKILFNGGSTDRILYDPVMRGDVAEGDVDAIKDVRGKLVAFLKKNQLPWGVKYDSTSQKLVVYHETMRKWFVTGAGRKPKVRGDVGVYNG